MYFNAVSLIATSLTRYYIEAKTAQGLRKGKVIALPGAESTRAHTGPRRFYTLMQLLWPVFTLRLRRSVTITKK